MTSAGRGEESFRHPTSDARSARDVDWAAARILELARRYRRVTAAQGRVRAITASLLAPLHSARVAYDAVMRYGHPATQDFGVSATRQFAWLWWLNVRHGYRPATAYWYCMFSRRRAAGRRLFLEVRTARVLYRVVVPRVAPDAARTLGDKRQFAAWCSEHGLPTPPVLVEFEGGRVTANQVAPGASPPTDLFAKWATRFGGGETARWHHRDGRYLDDAGRGWSFDEILATLTARSRDGVVVLQPMLVNDERIRPLSPNALSTVRVMTTRRPGEPPKFLAGVLRMGTGTATADNLAQGGIASMADPVTGVIGDGRHVDAEHRTRVYQRHPDTGAQITGFRIPRWDAVVRLAIEAHTQIGWVPAIGWDVAVLPDGPVLLEGNWNPGVKQLQVATQVPLLETEFAAAYAAWLELPECAIDDHALAGVEHWSPI